MAGLTVTPRQQAFIREYLVDLNATQAAIRAGYSEKTAKEMGYENLTKPHVAEMLAKAMAKREKRTLITQDYVLATIRNTVERCVAEEENYNPTAIFKGCELLGRHLGLFNNDTTQGQNFTMIMNFQGRDDARNVN